MNEHREDAPAMEVDYYLLGEGELARIHYSNGAEGVTSAEILNSDGRWLSHPVASILDSGMCISTSEARQRARELGTKL